MNCLLHEDEQSALCLMFISAAMLSILVSHEHCRGLGGICRFRRKVSPS
jgi:hypothetical protein